MSTKNLRNWSDSRDRGRSDEGASNGDAASRRGSPRAASQLCHRQGKTAVYLSTMDTPSSSTHRDGPLPRRPSPRRPGPGMSRPRLVVVIGANGAGKTTWSTEHRKRLPLHFYNADSIARASATRTIRSSRPRRGRSSTRPSRRTVSEPRAVRVREHLVGLIATCHRPDEPMARATKPMPCSSVPAIRTSTCNACGAVSLREDTTSPKTRSASMARSGGEPGTELAILRPHRDARQLRTRTAGRLRERPRCQCSPARAAAMGKEADAPGARMRESPALGAGSN